MLAIAIKAALVYWAMFLCDGLTSVQAFTRPIILGTVTGLVCGDLSTGIMMGASLEAVFMGISAVGGVQASDTRVATVVPVAMVIGAGMPEEAAMALAVTIGALVNSLSPVTKAIIASYHALYLKWEQERNWKAWNVLFFLDGFLFKNAVSTGIVFFSLWLGSESLATLISSVPAFVLNGMNAAAGMLVVIGFGLTIRTLWNNWTPVYFFIGFAMAKYMGLSTMVIALLGTVIAALTFKRDMDLTALKQTGVGVATSEEDDFYG